MTITDASNPNAILFIATSRKHAALPAAFNCCCNHAATHTQRQAAGYFRKAE
jgi:hypothetical protein